MAKLNFGGVEEEVVTREEYPLEKSREVFEKTNHCSNWLRCTRPWSSNEHA